MGALGIIIVVVVAVVAVVLLVGVLWFVRDSNKQIRTFAKSPDLIPGRPGRAPAEWSSATTPEALLHQRLRYAIAEVHSAGTSVAVPVPAESAAAADPSDLGDVDDAVFELDDRLIAAAQLPPEERTAALAELEPRVAALEGFTSRLWDAPSAKRGEMLDGLARRLRG